MVGHGVRRAAVCQYCKEKKIRCDDKLPNCSNCQRFRKECMNLDPATGEEIPRDHIAKLERTIARLKAEKPNISNMKTRTGPASLFRQKENVSIKNQISHDHKRRRDASSDAGTISAADVLNDEFVSMISIPDVGESSMLKRSDGARPPGRASISSSSRESAVGSGEEGIRDTSHPKRIKIDDRFSQGDAMFSFPVDSSSTSSLPSSSSPSSSPSHRDEATTFDAFDMAQKIGARDYTVTNALKPRRGRSNYESGRSLDQPFHPPPELNELCAIYFDCINCQVSVLDRTEFMDEIRSFTTNIQEDCTTLCGDYEDTNRSERCSCAKAERLCVIYMVIAIGYACRRKKSCEDLGDDDEAQKHFDLAAKQKSLASRCSSSSSPCQPQHNMFGKRAISVIGQLQEITFDLLRCLYSLMSPVSDGTWHILGSVLRQCVALGLHKRIPPFFQNPSEGSQNLLNECRRLFWAAFCLDRYISVSLRMPLTLDSRSIHAPMPWIISTDVSDETILSEEGRHTTNETGRDCGGRAVHSRDSYARQAKAEYNQLWDSIKTAIAIDPQRCIFTFYIKLRQIQSEIYSVLSNASQTSPSPPCPFVKMADWLMSIQERIETWKKFAPLRQEDIEAVECRFDARLLLLNLHQTELLYLGLNVQHAKVKGTETLGKAALTVLHDVSSLEEEGHIHFTWITLHNVCVASTLYLFCAWQVVTTIGVAAFHAQHGPWFVKSEEVELTSARVDSCMKSIGRRCSSGKSFRTSLQEMFASTRDLLRRYERRHAAQSASLGVNIANETGSSRSQTDENQAQTPWLLRITNRVSKNTITQQTSPGQGTDAVSSYNLTNLGAYSSIDSIGGDKNQLRTTPPPSFNLESYRDFFSDLDADLASEALEDLYGMTPFLP